MSLVKPPPQSDGELTMSFCLSVRSLFRCSFVCRQRVLVGHWSDWPSTAIVRAAISEQSVAAPVNPVPAYSLRLGACCVDHTDLFDYIQSVNALMRTDNYSATANNNKLVPWPLMGGLLHLVQRGGGQSGAYSLYQM